MRIFLCRWPNGDCSSVGARNKAGAIEKLDEVANAEGCTVVALADAQVHFALTDDGDLVLDGLGETTEDDIFAFCYPELASARVVGSDVGPAAQQERERDQQERTKPEAPATDLGRRAKAELDMPTTVINRLVSKAGTRRLRAFKPPGKPS